MKRYCPGQLVCAIVTVCGLIASASNAVAAVAIEQDRPADAARITQPAINWHVSNSFRLFTDAALTNVHRDIHAELGEDAAAVSPIQSAERKLAEKFPEGWAAAAYRKTCWRPNAHRYGGCRKDNPYINPRHHGVTVRVDGVEDYKGDCIWSLAPIRKADRKFRKRRKLAFCDDEVELDIPYPAGARVTVRLPNGASLTKRIRVKDIFIVGVGDSFGSGEGNPDQPVRFSDDRVSSYGLAPGDLRLDGYPARAGNWAALGDDAFTANGARWLGQACHRSLYSHQTRVALQLAIENPHRAVTYAHFSCAGAEITKGMFVKYKGNEWVPSPPRVPQISAVAEAQCGRSQAVETNYPDAYTIQGKLPVLRDMFLKKCPRKLARRIDLLLVSIGGNDVGFTKLVANAVLASKSTLQRLSGWVGGVYGPREAAPYMKELAIRFKALNRAVHGLLHVSWKQSDRVILTGYPPMAIVDEGGRVCPDGRAGMGVFPDFRLDAQKVRQAEDVANALNKTMRRAARRYKWSFVDAHRRAFVGHGLCADGDAGARQGDGPQADDVRIPRMVDGRWEPFPPSEYQPYASRGRWFRTPNDAYMTANYHVARSITRKILNAKKLRWFQVVLASTYSGAFHPTAQGHAAIADAVLPTARRVLKRYGQ